MLQADIIATSPKLKDDMRHAPLALSVIIPTLNEAKNIEPLLEKLGRVLSHLTWEAIIVDDHSTDGTAALVREIARRNPRVRVIERVGRRGLSTAVIEGFLCSSAPVMAVIDGDMQHDESALPTMVAAVADEAYDLAVGSRYTEGGGFGNWTSDRQRISRVATRLAGLVLKTPIGDPMSGFFVIRRTAFDAAMPKLSGLGFKILIDLIASSPRALRTKEVPYEFRTRVAGESKLDSAVASEYLMLLLDKLIGHIVPVRFIMFAAVGTLGLGVHLTVLALMLKWFDQSFTFSQSTAVMMAMTFNFLVNNVLTYRDRRLRGRRLVTGLLSFYAVCLVGAVANVGVGRYIYASDAIWWEAGLAGAVVGAVWNYATSAVVTWRPSNK